MTLKLSSLLVIALLIGSVGGWVYGLSTYQKRITSKGTLQKIGIETYFDSACTQTLNEIDWGILGPGSTKSFSFYIKNTENIAATLALETEGFTPPEIQQYLTLTFSISLARVLEPSEVIPATITLHLSPDVQEITSFTVDIIITATQTG